MSSVVHGTTPGEMARPAFVVYAKFDGNNVDSRVLQIKFNVAFERHSNPKRNFGSAAGHLSR